MNKYTVMIRVELVEFYELNIEAESREVAESEARESFMNGDFTVIDSHVEDIEVWTMQRDGKEPEQ